MLLTKWGLHAVNKMGLFSGGTPCCQQSVADFFANTKNMTHFQRNMCHYSGANTNKVLLISLLL